MSVKNSYYGFDLFSNYQENPLLQLQNQIKTHLASEIFKSITTAEFSKLLEHLPHSGRIEMASLLNDQGYSDKLFHINLHANWSENIKLNFAGCSFDSVVFTGNISNAEFSGDFKNCEFYNATLDHSAFNQSLLDHCAFVETQIHHTQFEDNYVNQTWVVNSEIEYSTFENNQIESSIISNSQVLETEFKSNQNDNVALLNSQNQHLNSSEGFVNLLSEKVQPVVGVVSDTEWTDPAVNAVMTHGALVEMVDPYKIREIPELNVDVKNGIIQYHLENSQMSIAQYLLQTDFKSIQEIKQIAKNYIDKVDALWIPGDGYDIHTEFYNQPLHGSTCSYSYTKEIFEFAMIEESLLQHKPIMGVCHGSQIINVYLGGDLHQDVGYHFAEQNLNISKTSGILGDAIKDGIIGESMHHQAMHHLGEGLEVVATYSGVIKGVQASDGSPIILTQFHPEYMGDSANNQIVENFVTAAHETGKLQHALDIADILHIDSDIMQNYQVKYQENGLALTRDQETQANNTSNLDTYELGDTLSNHNLPNDDFLPQQLEVVI